MQKTTSSVLGVRTRLRLVLGRVGDGPSFQSREGPCRVSLQPVLITHSSADPKPLARPHTRSPGPLRGRAL
jgi:hypothetical protein